RVRDRLLRGGDLDRLAASQWNHEELAGTAGLSDEGDRSIGRMEAEVAWRVEARHLLDRQRIARGGTLVGAGGPVGLCRHRPAGRESVSALASSCSPSSTVRR